MENLNTAITMVRKNCFMASVYFSDAFYSALVALVDQKHLPNGLSLNPLTLTKLLKHACVHFRN